MNKRNALRAAAARLRDVAMVEARTWGKPSAYGNHDHPDRKRMEAAHLELARRLDVLVTGRREKPPPPPDPNQVALFE